MKRQASNRFNEASSVKRQASNRETSQLSSYVPFEVLGLHRKLQKACAESQKYSRFLCVLCSMPNDSFLRRRVIDFDKVPNEQLDESLRAFHQNL
jgi:hypothetical protein